jgi:hypothetical protein
MLEILRARWHVDLPFAKLIELRDELDTLLHRIRAERHIRPPAIRCSRCGHVGEAAEPDVTVRATILSLGRFGMAPAEQVKTLEKRWAAYRKQNGLDLYGKTAEPADGDERVSAIDPGKPKIHQGDVWSVTAEFF